MAENILIAGDDRAFFDSIHTELDQAEFAVSELILSGNSVVQLPAVDSAVLLLSAELKAFDSSQLITRLRQQKPGWAVIVIASHVDKQHAISAISAGAADYLVSPLSSGLLVRKIKELHEPIGRERLIAHAPATRHAAQLARRAAVTSASILITGESGTGKEVFSRYIHQCSTRSDGPFVSVNCAAIPESMLESTLFGHEKGAYTGASSRRLGKFELADNGTLFLDEVAEMPLEQQAKLLRVLQEREVERLGGCQPIPVNVRIISATNRDLRKMVDQGLFREDLYYRLNVFPLHLAPLRERREDILPLTYKIMGSMATDCNQPKAELSQEAAQHLQRYDWPGNVRELENVIQRACVLKRGWVIMVSDLMLPDHEVAADITTLSEIPPLEVVPEFAPEPELPKASVEVFRGKLPGPERKKQEWYHLMAVLRKNNGHRTRSAKELGMTPRMLRYKLAQLRESGLDVDDLISGKAIAC